jgi:hypothetical protein
MKRRFVVGLLVLSAGLAITGASAAIFPQNRGAWPEDWPKELEPLRESSRTIGVGTGLQQNIYEIPVSDQEAFDKIWPAVLRVRTPGSPLTLYRAGTAPPKAWGDLLSNMGAAIRIYAPSGGYSLLEETDRQNPPNYDEWVREGRAARAQAPWPEYLIGEKGELPEWVVMTKGDDGCVKWVPADPFNKKPGDPRGFYHRARIDVELVVDGKAIDLNRTAFPDGVTVFDKRFK